MTLIQVINPNTSRAMTAAIGRAAREAAGSGVSVYMVQPDAGPEAIESHYEAALAVPGLLALVSAGAADGRVIACFGACRGAHASGLPVLGLESPGALEVVARECARVCARVCDADGCDVIVLGCAGMSPMAGPLSEALGIPVVDGVTAAVRIVGSLVALGLRTSARGEYAMLPSRHVVG